MGVSAVQDAFYFGPDQQPVEVIAGQNGIRNKIFYCKECGKRAKYRNGSIRIPHFAHLEANPDCYLYNAPSDAYAGTGKFLDKLNVIQKQGNATFLDAQDRRSIPAQLKLWLTLPQDGRGNPYPSLHLELPWIFPDAPDLDRLHSLDLRVHGAINHAELQSWRLWPGQVENRVAVHLQMEYHLDLDGKWPSEPGWRKDGLEAAKLCLSGNNLFKIHDSSHECGQLLAHPVELEHGDRLILLSRSTMQPPKCLKPERAGLISATEEWHIWNLFIPDETDLDDDGRDWLSQRKWVIRSPEVVRIVSPPPNGFDSNLPKYPPAETGWVLMRDFKTKNAVNTVEFWVMGNSISGETYRIPKGHAPKVAVCQAIPLEWSDIPFPSMVIRSREGKETVLTLRGGTLDFPREFAMAEGLEVYIRSLFPLEVMAGPPGQATKIFWRPDRPLDQAGADFGKALHVGIDYEIIVIGGGLAKQIVRLEAPQEVLRVLPRFGYHQRLRQMVGWPNYLILPKIMGA